MSLSGRVTTGSPDSNKASRQKILATSTVPHERPQSRDSQEALQNLTFSNIRPFGGPQQQRYEGKPAEGKGPWGPYRYTGHSFRHTGERSQTRKCLGKSLLMAFIQAVSYELSRHKRQTHTRMRKASVHDQPSSRFQQCTHREPLLSGCGGDFPQAQAPHCQLWWLRMQNVP